MSTSLRGVNLAGGEWGYDPTVTPVEGTHYRWVSHQDIDYLASKGVSFGRLLFSWEILQPALNGPFDPSYGAALADRVAYATGKGLHIMIEPHGGSSTKFARYKGNPVGSAAVPNSAFADLWDRLALLHKGNSKVIFGLMNEPNAISTVQWYAAAQAAIDKIRGAGATNLIMVPGNGFSQPLSWNQTYYDTATPAVSNAVGWLTLNDPLGNLVASVHTYFDTNAGGTDPNDVVGPNIIGQRLQPVVDWARPLGIKVHLSEFGASASVAGAQTAVANAIAYMNANADVIVGWSWWTYGPPSFWGTYPFTLSPTTPYTVDDPKLAWLTPHFNAPAKLYARDNVADTGAEPNATTAVGWESPDVWVRQNNDGLDVGEAVKGGQTCYVYVRVQNAGAWPSTGSEVVRVSWAKASSGLSYPAPWDGSVVSAGVVQGGAVDAPRPVPPTAAGQSTKVVFPWTTPNPVDYFGDGHFCLLARIGVIESAPFEGFSGPNLNDNVRNLSRVAWRNIHIVPVPKMWADKLKLGNVVATNAAPGDMHAQLAFEFLDEWARPVDPPAGTLLLTPQGAARERPGGNPDGTIRLADLARGISLPGVRPGEVLPFALESVPDRARPGYAVRAVQYAVEGARRTAVGGQTFVVGEVEGFTARRAGRRGCMWWPWALVSGWLGRLAAVFGKAGRKR
jgi:endoglucanase